MSPISWNKVLTNRKTVAAVQNFVNGSSIRSIIPVLANAEAKAEVYRLERNLPADKARQLARKALARHNKQAR